MNKIITSNYQLQKLSKQLSDKKKKVVLTHGVFDLVHIGHLKYFQEAKDLGNILIVSVTSDRYVKKGYNKPYFNEQKRCEYLSNLEIIDYVFLNDSISAVNSINLLKPNFYVKGFDYKEKRGDEAGNLKSEVNALKIHGGKFKVTSSQLFSSTELLNFNFNDFNPAKKKIDSYFKQNGGNKKLFIDNFYSIFKKIKKQKILVIGEIIIDKYISTYPLGKPSKEDILSVNLLNEKIFYGGAIPIVKTISQFSDDVTFLSIYNSNKIKKEILSQLNKKVKVEALFSNEYKDIVKTRFLNENNTKIFETYNHNSNFNFEKKVDNFLKKNLKKYSHVIVADFGHGLINDKIKEVIVSNSRHLSINVQTNSGNRGFNLFSKYKKADFLCVDLGELRLGLLDKFNAINDLLKNKNLNKYKNLILTLGSSGHIVKLKNKKTYSFPALNTKKILDTMGAGDAFYSYASCFVKETKDVFMISVISGIAGALKTQIFGHSKFVNVADVEKSLKTLIK